MRSKLADAHVPILLERHLLGVELGVAAGEVVGLGDAPGERADQPLAQRVRGRQVTDGVERRAALLHRVASHREVLLEVAALVGDASEPIAELAQPADVVVLAQVPAEALPGSRLTGRSRLATAP